MKNILYSILIILSATFVSSCKNDLPSPPGSSIWQIIENDTSYSLITYSIKRVGYDTILNRNPSLTLLAPGNNAFRAAGITQNTLTALTLDSLAWFVSYHILGTPMSASRYPVSDTMKAVNGRTLYVSNNVNGVFVNGYKLITRDIGATNGLIQRIDSVLLAPSQSIYEYLYSDSAHFSYFLAAIKRSQLSSSAAYPNKFTVFAVSDQAYQAVGYNMDSVLTKDSATIANNTKYHFAVTNTCLSDFINNHTVNTLQGQTLTLGAPTPTIRISNSSKSPSNIISGNILTTNGIILKIDKLMQ